MVNEDTSSALMRLAAEVGHRTPTGNIANTGAHLLDVVPEHDNQARRRLQILARLTADLARSVSSHKGVTP
jgi:hypothetical protein